MPCERQTINQLFVIPTITTIVTTPSSFLLYQCAKYLLKLIKTFAMDTLGGIIGWLCNPLNYLGLMKIFS
jgi:hypothetical protein